MPVSKNRKGHSKKSNKRKEKIKTDLVKFQKQMIKLQKEALEKQKEQAAIESVGQGMKFN